jgi:hypothetical protein
MKMAELAQKMVEMKMSMWEKMVDGSTKERMYETEGEYVCFLQIHFLRSFLRRPHTDRIPDGLPGKVPAEQKS